MNNIYHPNRLAIHAALTPNTLGQAALFGLAAGLITAWGAHTVGLDMTDILGNPNKTLGIMSGIIGAAGVIKGRFEQEYRDIMETLDRKHELVRAEHYRYG
ncbi:MAG: hypothetical protein PHY92_09925 [Alphaproteobacteria bacterium]|nr:hypothetical protein [Alphaproteobacteria bacterium]